jgi:hypothetical protein
MKLEKITIANFEVNKSEDGGYSLVVYDHKYSDVIGFVNKNIDMIHEVEDRYNIICNLKLHGYARIGDLSCIRVQHFMGDFTLYMNIFNSSCTIVTSELIDFKKGEFFYDITDVVKKIKEVKYSTEKKLNADEEEIIKQQGVLFFNKHDYIELFEEIEKLSSYEINQEMNPSKVAYNLSTINAIVNNYLKSIKNN